MATSQENSVPSQSSLTLQSSEKPKSKEINEYVLEHGPPSLQSEVDEDNVLRLNGEPVIRTGKDVSRFVVDIRDDGEDALTFRSVVLGTAFAGLGAALCQVNIFGGYHTRANDWQSSRFTYLNQFKWLSQTFFCFC